MFEHGRIWESSPQKTRASMTGNRDKLTSPSQINLKRCCTPVNVRDPRQISALRCCRDGIVNATTSISKHLTRPSNIRSVSFGSGTISPVLAGGNWWAWGVSSSLSIYLHINSRRRRQDMNCKFSMSRASGTEPHLLRVKASSTRFVVEDSSGDK